MGIQWNVILRGWLFQFLADMGKLTLNIRITLDYWILLSLIYWINVWVKLELLGLLTSLNSILRLDLGLLSNWRDWMCLSSWGFILFHVNFGNYVIYINFYITNKKIHDNYTYTFILMALSLILHFISNDWKFAWV
jgi:hypothetical protein